MGKTGARSHLTTKVSGDDHPANATIARNFAAISICRDIHELMNAISLNHGAIPATPRVSGASASSKTSRTFNVSTSGVNGFCT
jgi:hypothetical protein